jgi:predicted DNA-binding transcriptional regulator AlpA
MAKLYDSKAWLRKKYVMDKMEIPEIAKLCGVTEQTIYRKLHGFGLIKKR